MKDLREAALVCVGGFGVSALSNAEAGEWLVAVILGTLWLACALYAINSKAPR